MSNTKEGEDNAYFMVLIFSGSSCLKKIIKMKNVEFITFIL